MIFLQPKKIFLIICLNITSFPSVFFPQNNCCSYNRSVYLLSNLPLAFWFSCLILLCTSITTCDFSSLQYWTSAVTVFFKFLCLKKNSEHHKLIILLLFIQDDIFVHLQLYFTAISLNFLFSSLWLLNAFSFWIKIYYEGTLNYGSQSATCYHSLEHSPGTWNKHPWSKFVL